MPLPSIPGEQISTLYAFTIHPGGAGPALHGRLSHFIRHLLSTSRQQISMLYPCLYHPSRGSRSYTVWKIKPITKIRVIRPTTTYQLYHQTKPQKPQRENPPKTRKNHTTKLPSASHFHFKFTWHMSQAIAYFYLLLVQRPNRNTLSLLPTSGIPQQTTLCHATPIGGRSWAATPAVSLAGIKLDSNQLSSVNGT